MASARGITGGRVQWLVAQICIMALGVSWLLWPKLATVGQGLQSNYILSRANRTSLEDDSPERWQPFFQGSNLQDIPSVSKGSMIQYCRKALNSSSTVWGKGIGHSSYEYEMATSISTLAQAQVAQPLLNVCLVQQDCASCNAAAATHVDPRMFASSEVCQQTDLVERLFNERMIHGRGFDITRLCGRNVTEQWCEASASNLARCNRYQVHGLPLEVPVVAAFADAYITSVGHVFVENFVYKPIGPCYSRNEAGASGSIPQYSEVVVATAFWGDNFYHALIENLPRLMVVWEDLLARPEVAIAAGPNKAMAEYLHFMGISKDRIKTGNMMAQIAYVPNPGGCGCSPGHRYVRQLRGHMHQALKGRLPDIAAANNTILVIQRSGGTRRLANHQDLVAGIQQQYPLAKLEIFQDNPPPPLLQLARMFFSAKVIIAPHGAGLSNIVLASNKAVVIEILIAPIVTCYMDLARELGNDWYGIYGNAQSEHVAMHVNVQEVLGLVGKVL
jgi:hypothetical protein